MAGDQSQSCNVAPWMPATPPDGSLCNTNPTVPASTILSRAALGYLQNGQTYYVTLRGISGAGVVGLSPSSSFVFINSKPAQGLVLDTAVAQGPRTSNTLHIADDIDFQSDTCCYLIQWRDFTHTYDQAGVHYQAALRYDGQVRQYALTMHACNHYTIHNSD